MTWIGACSCGGGMRCDSEAEVVAAAQDHLAIAKASGGGDGGPLNHAVGIGQVTRTAILVPSWTTGDVPAPAAVPASPPASENGTAPRTLSPAEIMRALTRWELRFAEDEDADAGIPARKHTNPYTTDLDDEDEEGWGGPGQPPGAPDEGVTSLDELPEGIVIEDPGADYTLDKKESPQPVNEEGHDG